MELKEIRKKYNVTQFDMAKACGVSLNAYVMWERGIATPSDENRAKLNDVIEKLKQKN